MSNLKALPLVFFFVALLSFSAQAERPTASNPLQYIAQLGDVVFSKGGGAFLPTSVLSAMKAGQVSPIMQFVLAQHMMSECAEEALKYAPEKNDPYVVAQSKFDYGLCRVQRCFQQATLIMLLPMMAGTGSSTNNAMVQLAQSYQNSGSCDSQDSGFDPVILQILVGSR